MLSGNAVSPGIAVGPVYVYRPFYPQVEEGLCPPEGVEAELARLDEVKAAAAGELAGLVDRLSAEDPDKAKIFIAHQDLLNDVAMGGEIRAGVREKHWRGDWAIWQVYENFIAMLAQVPDPLIQERVADLKDIRLRLLRLWQGEKERNLSVLDRPVVVAAHDLLPSDTATLDRNKVLAILTEVGGATSHSAIIARSYGIPAVLAIPNLLGQVDDGMEIAVDALTGLAVPQPDEQCRAEYLQRRRLYLEEAEVTRAYLDAQPLTADGVRVDIGLNIASADAAELDGADHVDYIGLFRTEFLYMGRTELPSEEEQFEVYRRVLTAMGDRPTTLRTLDIGGDKTSECLPLPKEENPFLGNRALRLCLSKPELFRIQLRAALRASVYGNLWLMLPMVGGLEELRRAKALIAEVKAELEGEGKPVSPDFKTGIMIEVPSIALVAAQAAREVDFASIGSNDLCQYLTATDRGNPAVAGYYQSFHPALFRIIGMAVSAFQQAGKPISICGELGGDILAAPVLVGLGMRKLSMGLSGVAAVKRTLSTLTILEAETLAREVCACPCAGDAEGVMRAWAGKKKQQDER